MAQPASHAAAEPDVGPSPSQPYGGPWVDAEEVVDGLPVLAEVHAIERAAPTLPAVQAAAVAATGFVAGAATLALVRRRSARRVARVAARRPAAGLPIVGTRSFLVDVHLIAKPRA